YCFQKDITQQKRAEAALRRSEERFQLAARATNDAIYEWNFATGACWVNEAWQHQLGFAASGDIALSAWSDALHPDDRERVRGGIDAAIASGERSWSAEYRLVRADGALLDVATHGYIERDAEGVALRMVGATTDITERKLAE